MAEVDRLLDASILEEKVGCFLGLLARKQLPPQDPSFLEDKELSAAGWTHYNSIADAEGNLSKEAFHNLLMEGVEQIIKLPELEAYGAGEGSKGGSFEGNEDAPTFQSSPFYMLVQMMMGGFVYLRNKEMQAAMEANNYGACQLIQAECERKSAKIIAKIVKKALDTLPLLTDALFRFFDSDKSGSVSKKEAIVVLSFACAPGGPDPEMFKFIPGAVFRMIDEDSSGVIEPAELKSLVMQALTCGLGLARALVAELEPDIRGPWKDFALAKAIKKLKKLPIYVEGRGVVVVDAIAQGKAYVAQMEAETGTSAAMQMQRMGINPLQGAPDGVVGLIAGFSFGAIFSAFVVAFDLLGAADGTISKEQAVGVITSITANLVDEFAAVSTRFGLGFIEDKPLNFEPFFSGDSTAPLPKAPCDEIVTIVIKSLRKLFKEGKFVSFIDALFTFIDTNQDGRVSKAELFGVFQSITLFSAAPSVEAGEKLFLDIVRFFDGNNDGVLDEADLAVFADKVITLIFCAIDFGIEIPEVLVPIVLEPIFRLIFDVKVMSKLGGSSESFTQQEFKKCFAFTGMPGMDMEATEDDGNTM